MKAHKENNKVLIFCASKYKLHVAKTKHNVKTPDILLCILSLPNRLLLPCHKYYPRRDVLSWSPPMNLFLHSEFSRIPTAYTQACFAISCHVYRFYAHNIADMIMA